MPLPKRRTSRSKVRKRRSQQRMTAPNVTYCPKCGAPVLPHHVCPECGYYQGRAVIEVEEK
jgi:large subunit ribosomal protein L32